MTEIEKIAYAKSFIDKLANGINPIDDSIIPEDDVLQHVRLSRCLFYVSSLLNQMINEKSNVCVDRESKSTKRIRFNPFEVSLDKFRFSEAPIPMGEMHRRLDELVDHSKMRNLARSRIANWLVEIGMLTPPLPSERRYYGHPTEEGLKLGISVVSYTNEYGERSTIAFNREAQQFIIDHLGCIVKASAKKTKYQ